MARCCRDEAVSILLSRCRAVALPQGLRRQLQCVTMAGLPAGRFERYVGARWTQPCIVMHAGRP